MSTKWHRLFVCNLLACMQGTARRTAHRVMAKKKHIKDPGKKQKASRSARGKQRQARRDSWNTTRRQVTAP
ncbi:hypothetical protein HaLaN_08143, partial [Haematococcus lacustris]